MGKTDCFTQFYPSGFTHWVKGTMPDLGKVEHLKRAEVRQICSTTHLYPTPSEMFSNPFKNSALAYT